MSKREVAILEEGKMMGPALYRNALQLLLLDRIFLEEYFGDRINLETVAEVNKVHLTVSNLYPHAVDAKAQCKTSAATIINGGQCDDHLSLPANSSKEIMLDIQPSPQAMGRPNAVVIQYNWGGASKSTVASVELPPAISVHELLYGHASGFSVPGYRKQLYKAILLSCKDQGNR